MVKARLIIEVMEDDKVYVTGPLDNKKLCRAMLEEAIETVEKFKPGQLVLPDKKILDGTTGI
jgi:hypothetical protein